MKGFLLFIKFLIVLAILWFAGHLVFITVDGLSNEYTPADVAVVLGNKVELSGQPSPRLAGRLDRAIELYEDGLIGHVIVSGGLGKEGFSEAETMRDYLVDHGVDEEQIILDPDGNNTCKTAQNTREIMNEREFETLIAVSDFYHTSRTKLAFWLTGTKNISTASSKPLMELRLPYSMIREVAGFYTYLFGKCR